MQRLLITFARGEQTKYITHLDMMRFWERAFRRAHIALATTGGFHPHPRFALAAPLPVGVMGEGELMEVYLETSLIPDQCLEALRAQLVPGMDIVGIEELGLHLPSLQSLMRFADYQVTVESDRTQDDVQDAVAALLAARTFPWEHLRDGEVRRYDLRAQVQSLSLVSAGEGLVTLEMRLQCDSNASGRPEQVAHALGFPDYPLAILRLRLVLSRGPYDKLKPAAAQPRKPSKRPAASPLRS